MAIVMKFGGTSVADAAAFENVARIVASERRSAPVVVVSAMSGVTDALLAATNVAYARHPPATNVIRPDSLAQGKRPSSDRREDALE